MNIAQEGTSNCEHAPTPARGLRQALCNLFADIKTIEILVSDSGLHPARIDFSGAAEQVWHHVLREAQRTNRIANLIQAALAEYNHPSLQQAYQTYLQATPTAPLQPPESSHAAGDATTPFIVGPPISQPRHFFGRERELKRLFGLWQRPPLQNAAIIGPKRSGKTSLLYYLKSITTTPSDQLRPGQRRDWLPQPERYRWVYVDFQDPRLGTRSGLLQHVAAALGLRVPNPCPLETFMDMASASLRDPTLILLDEIGVALQRYPELDDEFWEALRSLAPQVGGNLGFVLAAHESPLDLAQHSAHSSPFFNIFGYTATLGPLTELEARALLATASLPFAAADLDWILAQSGCWPILLQVLARERSATLQEGESGNGWQAEGLRQIAPYRHLLGHTG